MREIAANDQGATMRRKDREFGWRLVGDGRIDLRPSQLALWAALSCLAVLAVTLMAAPAEAAVRIKGPAKVRVGDAVSFRASGLEPHQELTVNLAPTVNRGGNCCGVDVDEGHADSRGVAILRFRWPSHYRNGAKRVRWRAGARADVIVFGDAGRGIRTVRVRR